MISSLTILSTLKQAIDAGLPANTIDGKVYIQELPGALQNENIVVNMLVNPGTTLQEAKVNVNVYVMGIHEMQANLAKMHSIVNQVLSILHNTTHYIGGTTLHTSVENDVGIFPDDKQEGMYYYNIRLNCITL